MIYIGGGVGGGGRVAPLAPPLDPPLNIYYTDMSGMEEKLILLKYLKPVIEFVPLLLVNKYVVQVISQI